MSKINHKNNIANFDELRESLKAYETGTMEDITIPFQQGIQVSTPFFTFLIPDNYTVEENMEGFDVVCYHEDFSLTPLQITVKSEPLVLISPEEHQEQLKESILRTKGMTMESAIIGKIEGLRFNLPTLGGQQMFFPLYHTTEVFSLRIHFVGKIKNAEEITEKILQSFAFKKFQPRVKKTAVESICNVFQRNREKFKDGFTKGQQGINSPEEMENLCLSYANALFGCLRVLDEEIKKIKKYDIAKEDFALLCKLGEDFCKDMAFRINYQGEIFSVPTKTGEDIVKDWLI